MPGDKIRIMVRLRPLRRLPGGRYSRIASGVVIIGVAATTVYFFTRSAPNAARPTYDIVLPQRTTVESLGGWQRVSPEGSDPVFAYSDAIDDTDISVSQQPLPESFKGNVAAQVKQLADSYSATTVIEAGGTVAYIGRSARGPQSVIMAKNDTLILIKSEKTISKDDWIAYINNLVDPDTEQTPTF